MCDSNNIIVSIILAYDENNGIGNKGGLPWPRIASDMKWFKSHTLGKAIAMGRNTWESIGSKPLPGRLNIVVSGSDQTGDNALFVKSISSAIEAARRADHEEIIFIGGAMLWGSLVGNKRVDKIYSTKILKAYECDAHFDIENAGLVNLFDVRSVDIEQDECEPRCLFTISTATHIRLPILRVER